MALYRCGSGGGSASTLITKNITENGTYDAHDDNADGYSSVNVNVSSGGGCTINTQAEWDALTATEQKEQGLTVIQNDTSDYSYNWYDCTNFTVPIRFYKEMYSSSAFLNMPIQAMKRAIVFQGYWHNGSPWGNYDYLKINNIERQSDIRGDVTLPSWYRLPAMVYIMTGIPAQIISAVNGSLQNTYSTFGAIIEIDDDSEYDALILYDYYGKATQTYTLDDNYDAVICLTSKTDKEIYMNSDISINGTYTGKYGGRQKQYNDQDKSCVTAYFNVQSGAVFTITCNRGNGAGSAIIGFKRHQS